MSASLKFHWMLPKGGEVAMKTAQETARVLTNQSGSPAAIPDLEGWTRFARSAEAHGIDSVLLSFSRFEPDTLMISSSLGQVTDRLGFIAAYRLGLMQPALFVQQINTLSGFIGDRLSLNIVAGSSAEEQRGYGDFLDHDERYERAEEYLAICRAFWENEPVDHIGKYYTVEKGQIATPYLGSRGSTPEIFIAGHSDSAQRLALSQGSCWLRLIDTPEKIAPFGRLASAAGKSLCLRLCLVCRETKEAALAAAEALLPHDQTITRRERKILSGAESKTLTGALELSDEIAWLNETIWTGLIPHYGSSAITVVGSYEEVAQSLQRYQGVGVSQFIISGWPKLDEMEIFGRNVLPLIRKIENG